jgi:threonine aldolase
MSMSLFKKRSNLAIPRHQIVDLRSDTVTRPSKKMREAMRTAIVGDDVLEDDPTVGLLEERVAGIFEKESALFFPTGTMANLAAIMSWCDSRDSEMLIGSKSHICLYEQGGAATVAGVTPMMVPQQKDGTMDIDELLGSVRVSNVHYPVTRLVCLENTHNFCGGRAIGPDWTDEVGLRVHEKGVPVHLDGARVWNAAEALECSVARLTEQCDSVNACLSKALGAPAGSVLCGSAALIAKARRARKVLGGGMRQVGVLAAAGLVALDDYEAGMLIGDHERTQQLAEGLHLLPGLSVDLATVDTNMIVVEVDEGMCSPERIVEMVGDRGVLILALDTKRLRLVLHRDVSDADVKTVLKAFASASLSFFPRPVAQGHVSVDSEVTTTAGAGAGTGTGGRQSDTATRAIPVDEVMAPENKGAKGELAGAEKSGSRGGDATPKNTNYVNPAHAAAPGSAVLEEWEREELEGLVDEEGWDNDGLEGLGDEPSEPVVYFEDCVVHGLSTSDDGFVALLRGLASDRVLRVPITPGDPMSDGLDKEQAETPEAVTLLQLLQGIDVESHLPCDALKNKFAAEKSGARPQVLLLQFNLIFFSYSGRPFLLPCPSFSPFSVHLSLSRGLLSSHN